MCRIFKNVPSPMHFLLCTYVTYKDTLATIKSRGHDKKLQGQEDAACIVLKSTPPVQWVTHLHIMVPLWYS